MPLFSDDTVIELPCPNCGKEIKKPLSWFKNDGNVCPFGCGLALTPDNIGGVLKKIEQGLSALSGQSRKIHLKF